MMFASTKLAKLYERVNDLNIKAIANNTGCMYWTVIVMYNRVIFEKDKDGKVSYFDIIKS